MSDAVIRAARPIALAVIVLTGVLLGWSGRAAALSDMNDDATYVSLSKSLESGRYRDEFLVGSPPHAQYPPGMPAWLLVIRRISGSVFSGPQFASFLLLAVTALLFADALRLLGLPWLGVGVSAAVMFNPGLMWTGGELMSETLYLTCSSFALWFSLKNTLEPMASRSAMAVAAAIAAFLTRSVGVVILGAIEAALVLRRRKTSAIVGGIVSVLVVLGWFGYTAWAARRGIGHNYAADFASIANQQHSGGVVARAIGNMRWYISRMPEQVFGVPDIPGTAMDTWLVAASMLGAVGSGLWYLRRQWPSAVLSVVFSGAVMLLFWPFLRLAVPIVPVLIVAMALGAMSIARLLGSRRPEAVAVLVTVGLALVGVKRGVANAMQERGCHPADVFTDEVCYDVATRTFMAAERFLRDSVPAGAIVASSKPAAVYLVSAHKGLHWEVLLRGKLDGYLVPAGPVTHLLLSRLMPYESREAIDSLLPLCRRVELVRAFPPGTLLIAIRETAVPENACDRLLQFKISAASDSASTR